MDYFKKPEETDLGYIVRLVEGKSSGLYDVDYVELFKLIFNVELSSCEARKRFYGLRMILPYIESDKICFTTAEDLGSKLQDDLNQLKKEKMKIQTETQRLNQMLREQARYELFNERVTDALKECIPLNPPEFQIKRYDGGRSGLLLFGDCHYGKEIIITGLNGEVLNKYDVGTFEKRMWALLFKTIHICEKENLNKITIMNLGDELEGVLRISQLMSLKYGVVDSAVYFSNFLASWLNELSKSVYIDYYATEDGNHTEIRMLTGKKGDFQHENMSKIINVMIELMLKDNNNIKIHKNHTEKIFTEIEGFNILGTHGEDKDIQQAIRDYQFMYGVNIDYIITGHKHHANSMNLGMSKGSIGVGSIMGIDDFSMKLKKMSEPSATFVVLSKDNGKIEYNIQLPL